MHPRSDHPRRDHQLHRHGCRRADRRDRRYHRGRRARGKRAAGRGRGGDHHAGPGQCAAHCGAGRWRRRQGGRVRDDGRSAHRAVRSLCRRFADLLRPRLDADDLSLVERGNRRRGGRDDLGRAGHPRAPQPRQHCRLRQRDDHQRRDDRGYRGRGDPRRPDRFRGSVGIQSRGRADHRRDRGNRLLRRQCRDDRRRRARGDRFDAGGA